MRELLIKITGRAIIKIRKVLPGSFPYLPGGGGSVRIS
jgi:hypothetical protein